MSTPRISVVIPAYNAARYIGPTIESVLAQTWRDFELVVVDNASTDTTTAVVKRFADPRLRLVKHEKHVGPGENFNRALDEAAGEFIKLLPADDILYPLCLERQAAILDDPLYRNVVMVSCARDVIDEAGRKVVGGRAKLRGRVPGAEAIRWAVRAGANIIGEPLSVLFRAAVLTRSGRFEAGLPFMLDMDLWVRMLRHGDLYALTEPLGAFRISTGSMSFGLIGQQSRQFHAFIRKLRQDPAYGLSRSDAILGSLRAIIREAVRVTAYRCFLGRRGTSQ